MSITVASGTLDTAWQEFSTVDYPASTLGTLSACIDEVGFMVRPGDSALTASTVPSSTQVAKWLMRAKQELAEVKNFTWRRRYATATLTSGSYRFSLPPDFGGMFSKTIRDTTNDRTVRVIDKNTFDSLYPDVSAESGSQIKVAAIKGRELWVTPAASGEVVEISYLRSGDDITADMSWLPEIERWRCVDFAIAEAFHSLHQDDQGDRYMSRWVAGIGKAIRADGKRKWSQQGYQARSGFQVM